MPVFNEQLFFLGTSCLAVPFSLATTLVPVSVRTINGFFRLSKAYRSLTL